MKDYDKNKEFAFLQYRDLNTLYGWAMSQKLPLNNFDGIKDTSQFNEDFIKGYLKDIFFEVNVQYVAKLHELHNELPFLPEWMKIEKVQKVVDNLHDKTEYGKYIRNLNQALDHGLSFKKVHKVIKLNQNVWPKPSIDMNTELRKKEQK